MYNGVLVLSVLEVVTIASFADDLTVVITAKYPKNIELYAMETVRLLKSWLEIVRLVLVRKRKRS